MDWKNKFNKRTVETEDLQKLKWGLWKGEWKLFSKAMRKAVLEVDPTMKFHDQLTEEMKGQTDETPRLGA